MIDTRESLLDRLKSQNAHDAWKEFYEHYWGTIIRYGQKLGLNEHQAEEVLQETMVALMQILPEFVYRRDKGRFRNFLLTIVHRKVMLVRRRARGSSEVPWDAAAEAEHANGGEADVAGEAQAVGRWRDAVCEEALRRLRDDPGMAPTTFAIFQSYVIERCAAADVARTFGVTENGVYQIKNRLLRRLRHDVAVMMRNAGADSA